LLREQQAKSGGTVLLAIGAESQYNWFVMLLNR